MQHGGKRVLIFQHLGQFWEEGILANIGITNSRYSRYFWLSIKINWHGIGLRNYLAYIDGWTWTRGC